MMGSRLSWLKPSILGSISCACMLMLLASAWAEEANHAYTDALISSGALSLDDYIKHALHHNPDLTAAQWDVLAAEARRNGAKAGRWPRLSFEGTCQNLARCAARTDSMQPQHDRFQEPVGPMPKAIRQLLLRCSTSCIRGVVRCIKTILINRINRK